MNRSKHELFELIEGERAMSKLVSNEQGARGSCRVAKLGSFSVHDSDGRPLTAYVYQVALAGSGKRMLQLMTAWGAPLIRIRQGRYLLEDGREFRCSDPSAP
jgi:hypothetical protein